MLTSSVCHAEQVLGCPTPDDLIIYEKLVEQGGGIEQAWKNSGIMLSRGCKMISSDGQVKFDGPLGELKRTHPDFVCIKTPLDPLCLWIKKK
jgi:hypothetical protein